MRLTRASGSSFQILPVSPDIEMKCGGADRCSMTDAVGVEAVVQKVLKNTQVRVFEGFVPFEDDREAWTFLEHVGNCVRSGVKKGWKSNDKDGIRSKSDSSLGKQYEIIKCRNPGIQPSQQCLGSPKPKRRSTSSSSSSKAPQIFERCPPLMQIVRARPSRRSVASIHNFTYCPSLSITLLSRECLEENENSKRDREHH